MLQFKPMPLQGGTLVVSIPHIGVGALLLTDFLLDRLKMDQVAALDAEEFPPIAMMRKGRPRYPVRIHADPVTKTAVLRCQFNAVPAQSRGLAKAILAWAADQRLSRIVILDGVLMDGVDDPPAPEMMFAAAQESGRARALSAGLREIGSGILGGVVAMLLLQARSAGIEVVALLAGVQHPVDDARSGLAFGKNLQTLLPNLHVDLTGLESQIEALQDELRRLQEGAEKAVERLVRKRPETPMYG